MAPLSFIAIIGSASDDRGIHAESRFNYGPAVDAEGARRAARELGLELARQGFGLIVYSGDPDYIEHYVVQGFLEHPDVPDRCIRICTNLKPGEEARELEFGSSRSGRVAGEIDRFEAPLERRRVFDDVALDESEHWEVSFYRSLRDADGVLLIGGGLSTLNAGLVAIANRIPMIALGCFGGKARIVHDSVKVGVDLPHRSEMDLMARPWTLGSAAACVRSLKAQAARRSAGDPSKLVKPARLAAGLFALALLCATLAWLPLHWGTFALFLGPLFAGAAGAIVRVIVGSTSSFRAATDHSLEIAGYLGSIAGGIVTALFIAAQLGTTPSLTTADDSARSFVMRLIPFALAAAFIAGLTLDQVLTKLIRMDVLRRVDPDGGDGA